MTDNFLGRKGRISTIGAFGRFTGKLSPLSFSDRLPRHALRLGAGPGERGAVRIPLHGRRLGQRRRLPESPVGGRGGRGHVPHARLRDGPRHHLRHARRALRLHSLLRVHPEDGIGEVSFS